MYTLGILCMLNSGFLLLLGIGGLMMNDSHISYGVKTSSRYKAYCWAIIILSITGAAFGFILSR